MPGIESKVRTQPSPEARIGCLDAVGVVRLGVEKRCACVGTVPVVVAREPSYRWFARKASETLLSCGRKDIVRYRVQPSGSAKVRPSA